MYPGTTEPNIRTLVLGNNIRLLCRPDSNLAQVRWNFNGKQLLSSDRKFTIYSDGILIYNASTADAGRYTCTSVERVKGRPYTQTLAIYDLQEKLKVDVTENTPTTSGIVLKSYTTSSGLKELKVNPLRPETQMGEGKWVVMQVALAVLSVMMGCLLIWNLYMGHISPSMCFGRQLSKTPRNGTERGYGHKVGTEHDSLDVKQQTIRLRLASNSDVEATNFHWNAPNGNVPTDTRISKYITDESEIWGYKCFAIFCIIFYLFILYVNKKSIQKYFMVH